LLISESVISRERLEVVEREAPFWHRAVCSLPGGHVRAGGSNQKRVGQPHKKSPRSGRGGEVCGVVPTLLKRWNPGTKIVKINKKTAVGLKNNRFMA
jgi:hypothetical protein